MEVSIIIPVYNGQKSIPKIVACIEEIPENLHGLVEVIFVNDGSSDMSVKLINEYRAQSIVKVSLYSQNNAGVSSARNLGLEKSNATYIFFSDVDDQFFLEKSDIYGHSDDVISFDVTNESGKLIRSGSLPLRFDKINASRMTSVWGRLYRREFLLQNNICFQVGLRVGEDLIFNLEVLKSNPRQFYVPSVAYVYGVSEDSTTELVNILVSIKNFLNIMSISIKREHLDFNLFSFFWSYFIKRQFKKLRSEKYNFNIR